MLMICFVGQGDLWKFARNSSTGGCTHDKEWSGLQKSLKILLKPENPWDVSWSTSKEPTTNERTKIQTKRLSSESKIQDETLEILWVHVTERVNWLKFSFSSFSSSCRYLCIHHFFFWKHRSAIRRREQSAEFNFIQDLLLNNDTKSSLKSWLESKLESNFLTQIN